MVPTFFDRLQTSFERLASAKVIRLWMRSGYGAKGIIYLMVGLFALAEAFGSSVPLVGTEGLLVIVLRQPFGVLFLLLLAVGIAGYAFWRFIQAVVDPEHSDSTRPLRLVQRLGYAASSLSYASVAYGAIKLSVTGTAQQDDTIEDLTAQLLESAGGVLLLFLSGVAVITIGFIYIYGGLSGGFISQFKAHCHSHLTAFATRLGQIGYTARGAAFTVIGAGLGQAIWRSQSDPAGGLENALQKIDNEPYGQIGLGLIAIGFIAYAIYAFLVAIYRHFDLR